MNLERFHALALALEKEFSDLDVAGLLKQLVTALRTSISSPNEASAEAFGEAYSNILDVLSQAPSNSLPPTERLAVKQINAEQYAGVGLATSISAILQNNQVTPAKALNELTSLTSSTNEYFSGLGTITTGMGEVGIAFEEIEPGEFEIGISLPKTLVGESIEKLENEFHDINLVIKTFQEIAGLDAASAKVRTLANSDWQLFIETGPIVAAALAHAIERIVALYKTNLEIRLLKNQLEDKKLPEAVLRPLQEHIEATVRNELRVIAEEIVNDNYRKADDGRKNELQNQTTMALKYIADRIDRGATIDVSAKPPIQPQEPEKEASEVERAKYATEFQEYQRLSRTVEAVNKAMKNAAALARSNAPILAIEYENEKLRDVK